MNMMSPKMNQIAVSLRADLARAFDIVTPVVEKLKSYPILENILIKGDGKTLFVMATDLDIEVCVALPAQAPFLSSITVPAKAMKAHLKSGKTAEYVTITPQNGNVAAVALDSLNVSMATRSADEFPMLKRDFAKAARFTMSGAVLHDALDSVMGAISTEETRYYLNGVYIHVVDGKLVMATTDGHRLYKRVLDLPEGAEKMPGIILPRKSVATLHRLTKGKQCPAEVSLEITELSGRFSFDNVTVTTKMIEGTFPDYERVTPKHNDKIATLDAAAAIVGINQVKPTTKDGAKAVKLTLGNNHCTLECRSADDSSASTTIPVKFVENWFEIGFNCGYLLDMLTEAGGTVKVEFNDSGSPTVFTGQRNGWKGVLMPMRV